MASLQTLLPVALWLSLAAVSSAKCAFTQPCYTGKLDDPTCVPVATNSSNDQPKPFVPQPGHPPMPCPQYEASACCNNDQASSLFVNFILLNSAFGSAQSGGCPACVENVKELWCAFTCAPNQADFTTVLGHANMTDPSNKDEHGNPKRTLVLKTQLNIHKDFACSLFQSCKDTGKVRKYSPLQTWIGLLNYMGQTQAIGRGSYTEFVLSEDPKALNLGTSPCNNFTDPMTGEQSSCPCATCAASCSCGDKCAFTPPAPTTPVMRGFDWVPVTATYAATAVFITLVAVVRCRRAKSRKRTSSHIMASDGEIERSISPYRSADSLALPT